jgi:cell wall-associated NlpC family hydrolase
MRRTLRPALVGCGVAAALLRPGIIGAQAVHAEVGRLFEADGWTTYRLGFDRTLIAPLGIALYGTHLRDESAAARRHWGAGADLVLLRGRRSGPYLLGGYAGGFSSDTADAWWRSWSAGGGYQVVLAGTLALSGEVRYRAVRPGSRDGVELSVRLGGLLGGGAAAPADRPEAAGPRIQPPPAEPERRRGTPPLATVAPAAEAEPRTRLALADSVVATALAALGTGYRMGGTSAAGFDCSGLIQHAYARHGIRLPRVSRDQAREGEAVNRTIEALRPGDILTFAERGRRVTHVGLYLGNGRFVHSARGGVQVSRLSEDDPQGRWYWKRWIGARRIVG